MKPLLVWLAIGLLSLGVVACAGSRDDGPRPRSNAATTTGQPEDYADGDGDVHHKDDSRVLDYGHVASATDTRVIAALFKRYYAAAARDDGAVACSLFYPPFVKRLFSGYEQPLGRPSRRGEMCATLTSKLFEEHHDVLAIEVAKLKVIGARVADRKGYLLLRFETVTPETLYMPVHLESGVWKIEALFRHALL